MPKESPSSDSSERGLNPFAGFIEASSFPAISVEPIPGFVYKWEVNVYLLVNPHSNIMLGSEEVYPSDLHAPSSVVTCVRTAQELKIAQW